MRSALLHKADMRSRLARVATSTALTLLVLLGVPSVGRGQGFLPVALGVRALVGDILDEFEGTATRILSRAEDTGNAVIGRAGAELRLSIRNIGLVLEDQRNRSFQDLDLQFRAAFVELNALIESVNALERQAANLEELAALDIQQMLNRLPLVQRRHFYVSSIRGYILSPWDSAHRIAVRGMGVGLSDPDRSCDLGLTIGEDQREVPVAGHFVRGPDQYTATVAIPPGFVSGRFSDEALVHVPASFICTIRERGVLRTRLRRYVIPFTLVLLPRVAGHLDITEYRTGPEHLTGDTAHKPFSKSWRQNECSDERPCLWSELNACVADNQRITGVLYECHGGAACGFATSVRRIEFSTKHEECWSDVASRQNLTAAEYRTQLQAHRYGRGIIDAINQFCYTRVINYVYQPDYEPHGDGVCASLFRQYNADAPVTVTYKLAYRTATRLVQPHALQRLALKFNETLSVPLDPANEECHFEATGLVKATNQRIEVNHISAIGGRPLRLVSNGRVGARCVAVFQLQQ